MERNYLTFAKDNLKVHLKVLKGRIRSRSRFDSKKEAIVVIKTPCTHLYNICIHFVACELYI